MCVSSFYKPQIHVTGCQKKHEDIDFIDIDSLTLISLIKEESSTLLDLKPRTYRYWYLLQ